MIPLPQSIKIPRAWYDYEVLISSIFAFERPDSHCCAAGIYPDRCMVNGFSLWVGFGAALGLWRVWRSAPERQASEWIDLGLLSLFGALIGARLYYVWLNWDYFVTHKDEIAQVSQGGLGWPGAAAGAAAVILLFLILQARPGSRRRARHSIGVIGDRLYPLLPPLAVSAWLGCWQIGASYGAVMPDETWWAVLTPDETGAASLRFPLQALAAASLLLFFWLVESRQKTPRTVGHLSEVGLTGLLLHLLAFSLLIAEPAPTWNGLRIETWAAILLLALFLILRSAGALGMRLVRKYLISVR